MLFGRPIPVQGFAVSSPRSWLFSRIVDCHQYRISAIAYLQLGTLFLIKKHFLCLLLEASLNI